MLLLVVLQVGLMFWSKLDWLFVWESYLQECQVILLWLLQRIKKKQGMVVRTVQVGLAG
jgi:hypothetical protein